MRFLRWLLHGDEGWPHVRGRPRAVPLEVPTFRGEPDPPRPSIGLLSGDTPLWTHTIPDAAQRRVAYDAYAMAAQRRYESPEEAMRLRAAQGPPPK